MAALTFKGFRGNVARMSERLQSPNFAHVARNIRITSGRLDSLRGPVVRHTSLLDSIRTIWRYRHFTGPTSFVDYWVPFTEDVDVVLSPLSNDDDGRFFWTSDEYEPRYSSFALAIQSQPYPTQFYALGIPSPTTAPTLTAPALGATNELRAYAFTFATADGQESGTSPASAVLNGNISGTWALSNIQTAPPNTGTVTGAVTASLGRVRLTLDTVFGLEVGNTLTVSGIVGMTDANKSHRLLAVNKSGNTVDVALSTAQTYTSGGAWARNAPIDTTGMVKRIYRQAGTDKSFFFVAEIPVATTTYNDTVAGSALGELIESATTLPPPATLRCLVSLPNGCLCGIAGNEVCFSDPYKPYSWPASNRYSFSGRGVALVPAGTSVIVLTDGFPILVSGTDPESMSPSTMETYAPCVSKRGVVNVGGGALYPSSDGLWLAAPGAVQKRTANLYRQVEWDALGPTTFVAAFHEGQYYASHQGPGDFKPKLLVLDISEMDSAVSVDEAVTALYRNDYDGRLYIAKGNQVLEFDASDVNKYIAEWTSVEVQLDQPRNFSVAQVHAKYDQIVKFDDSVLLANRALIAQGPDAVNGHSAGFEILSLEVCGSNLRRYMTGTERKVQFNLFDGDRVVYSTVVTSMRPFKLPAGFKIEVLRVGINASIPVYSATIAQSTAELAQAST
jgi:hypothetical protein